MKIAITGAGIAGVMSALEISKHTKSIIDGIHKKILNLNINLLTNKNPINVSKEINREETIHSLRLQLANEYPLFADMWLRLRLSGLIVKENDERELLSQLKELATSYYSKSIDFKQKQIDFLYFISNLYRQFHIYLYERRKGICDGSSDDTPCRWSFGGHYPDIPTAEQFCSISLDFFKHFHQFILKEKSWHYYIHKDSLFSKEHVEQLFKAIKAKYDKIISESILDPIAKEKLVKPEELYKELTQDEILKYVLPEVVLAAYSTGERILNWPEFKIFLDQQIKQDPHIVLQTDTEIEKFNYDIENGTFAIKVKDLHRQETTTENVDFFILSAWEANEKILAKSNYESRIEPVTNRFKIIIDIALPKNFLKDYPDGNAPSCMFLFGPFASLTILDENSAFLSYEYATNLKNVTVSKDQPYIDDQLVELFYNKTDINDERVKKHFGMILEGAEKFFPGIKESKINNYKLGIVRVDGEKVELNSCNSSIHKRTETGVKDFEPKAILNESRKLLYGKHNGEKTLALFQKHMWFNRTVDSITELNAKNANMIKSALVHDTNLSDEFNQCVPDPKSHDKEEFPALLKLENNMVKTIETKQKLISNIKTFFASKTFEVSDQTIGCSKMVNESMRLPHTRVTIIS